MQSIESRLAPYIAMWLTAAERGEISWQVAWDAIQCIELAVAETCEHLKSSKHGVDIVAAGAYNELFAAKKIIATKVPSSMALTYVGPLKSNFDKEHLDALQRIN